jgi:hypothetical protein
MKTARALAFAAARNIFMLTSQQRIKIAHAIRTRKIYTNMSITTDLNPVIHMRPP